MNSYPVLHMVHSGAAILLFSLAIISVLIAVLIAVKPAADPANTRLVKKANIVEMIEIIVAVVVAMTGMVAVVTGAWPWSQLWVWLSLVIMVFFIAALIFITRPARMSVAIGGSEVKTGMQVILQMGHVLLLFVTFALMFLKPA